MWEDALGRHQMPVPSFRLTPRPLRPNSAPRRAPRAMARTSRPTSSTNSERPRLRATRGSPFRGSSHGPTGSSGSTATFRTSTGSIRPIQTASSSHRPPDKVGSCAAVKVAPPEAAIKINKEVLAENGLACPFAKPNPSKSCRPDRGWSKVGDIACVCPAHSKPSSRQTLPASADDIERFLNSEHIWRFHSQLYQCEYCGRRWTGTQSRKDVTKARNEHMSQCEEKRRGRLRSIQPTDLTILRPEQQADFEKATRLRGNEKKFAAFYRACGQPEPESYRMCGSGPGPMPFSSHSFGFSDFPGFSFFLFPVHRRLFVVRTSVLP